MKKAILLLLFFVQITAVVGQWNHEIPLHHVQRNKRDKVRVWYSGTNIKGFMLFGSIGNALTYATNSNLRNFLAANQLGIVYIRTQQYGMSIFKPNTDSAFFWKVLDSVAIVTGIPAFRHGSWVLFGHSTDGLFVQNVACWKPDRTLGMLHYKSGNLGNKVNMQAPWNVLDPLKNIPFLAISGRFEEFGPNGPYPGCSAPYPNSCYREGQWLAMRDTLMKLRQRDFLVCHLVDHYNVGTHGSWSGQSADMMTKFAIAVANAQLPAGYPDSQPFVLKRMRENQGALSDSALSHIMSQNTLPSYPVEAEFDLFPSQDENFAYWHHDKDFSESWVKFHHIQSAYYPPLKPLNLQAQAISSDKIQITWSDTPANETGYVVQRQLNNGDFGVADTVPANVTTLVDSGLTANSTYSYRIYAYNSDGVSALSNQDSATTFITGILKKQPYREKIRIHSSAKEIILFTDGLKIGSAELLTLEGKMVQSFPDGEHKMTLPTGISKGFYWVKIRMADQSTFIKAILLNQE
jgi:hypothetical protein